MATSGGCAWAEPSTPPVVTGWAVADESLGADEVFCPTCGRLVGRDRTDQDWIWVPLEGD